MPAFSITVKVTGKSSKGKKLSKTLKCAVTVKTPSIALNQTEATLAIGEDVKLTSKVAPASSGSSVTYTTSDEKIATVANDGTVKAVAEGEATITASAKCGTKTVTATAKVSVKKTVFKSVTQTKLTELAAEIAGETKDLKTTDFSIVNTATKVVYPVSKVTVDSKDATKVTLTLFSELKDGQNYDVTLNGVTKSFKASDGQVASIAVDPITIPYATETEIKLISKDANGVVVKELTYPSTDANYDFTINANGNGYTNGSKLYLNKVGDTATAEITYKSGKYDQNGKPEGNIGPNKVTITATEQAAVSAFDVRIDNSGKTYDKAKDTKKIAVGETKTAYCKISDADGKEVSDYSKYSVESSDKTILMLAGSNITSKSVGITGAKAGTAYILVKDKDNKVVSSVAVDVVAERAVATMELDVTNFTLSNKLSGANKDVNVKLKDQYGDDWSGDYNLQVECLSTTASGVQPGNVAAADHWSVVAAADKKVNFIATTNTVVIATTDKVDANSYRLDISSTNMDIKVDNDNKTSKTITVDLIGRADGVDLAKTNATYTVKDKDGKVLFTNVPNVTAVTNAAISASATTLTITPVTVSSTTGSAIATKNLSAGQYTVTATATVNGSTINMSGSFTLTDSQSKPTVEVKENTVAGGTVAAALGNALVVRYGDKVYTNIAGVDSAQIALTIAGVEGTLNDGSKFTSGTQPVSAGKYFTVSKLLVTVEVADGISMDVEVTVPGSITIK